MFSVGNVLFFGLLIAYNLFYCQLTFANVASNNNGMGNYAMSYSDLIYADGEKVLFIYENFCFENL